MAEKTIIVPDGLHPDTAELVVRFASALAEKLRKAETKYGYNNGWKSDDWEDECMDQLITHVEKGDPRDIAAYCAFMWHHGWKSRMQIVSYAVPRNRGGACRGD